MAVVSHDTESYLRKLVEFERQGVSKYTEVGNRFSTKICKVLQSFKSEQEPEADCPHPLPFYAVSSGYPGNILNYGHGSGDKVDFDIWLLFGIEDVHDILLRLPCLISHIARAARTSGSSLQYVDACREAVKVKYGGYVLNLVPVFHVNPYPDEPWEWEEVLEFCKDEEEPYIYKTPSFSAALRRLKFYIINNQPPLVENVILLALLWDAKAVNLSKYMANKKVIIDLLAIKAGHDELSQGTSSLGGAFKKFLETLTSPRKNVVVILDTSEVEFPFAVKEQMELNRKKTGILVDPCNPYVNYLDPANLGVAEGWEELRKAAKESLVHLEGGMTPANIDAALKIPN